MGVLGEMFPGPKLRRESGEAGNGEGWWLGPVDLDNDVVELQPVELQPVEPEPVEPEADDGGAGHSGRE